MKRRQFIAGSMAGMIYGLSNTSPMVWGADGQARPLPRSSPNSAWDKGFLVVQEGRYFLEGDAIQRSHWTIEGQYPKRLQPLLKIWSGNVDIDLRGHELGGDLNSQGVLINSRTPTMAETYPSTTPHQSVNLQGVSLRNGVIDLKRGQGNGVGILAVRTWRPHEQTGDTFYTQSVAPGAERKRWIRPSPMWRDGTIPPLQANAFPGFEARVEDGDYLMEIVRGTMPRVDYVRADYLFENLTIRAELIAMAVEGDHITLRNCTIESQGVAALFLAGPNVTIENCTIHLGKQSERSLNQEYPVMGAYFARLPKEVTNPPRAAIVLRDGSNAVIRNNRIRVDYPIPGVDPCVRINPGVRNASQEVCARDSPVHCILVQDGAKNVLIEDNLFINVRGDPVTLSAGAEAIVRGNAPFDDRNPPSHPGRR